MTTVDEVFNALGQPLLPLIVPSHLARWMTNSEIAALLLAAHHNPHWLHQKPLNKPAHGSMFLLDRERVKFRKDGHNWKKRKDGRADREDHMKLQVDKVECLYGSYAHAVEPATFKRRCYWLLCSRNKVLVHYLDENLLEEVEDPLGLNAQAQAQVETKPPPMHFSNNPASYPYNYMPGTSQPLPPYLTLNLPLPLSTSYPQFSATVIQSSDSAPPALLPMHGESLDLENLQPSLMTTFEDSAHPGLLCFEDGDVRGLLSDHAMQSTESVMCDVAQDPSLQQLGSIIEVSPSWAYNDGDEKVLVIGQWPLSMILGFSCTFGDKVVVAEVVCPFVLRCTCPPHDPGIVPLFVSLNGQPISKPIGFDFRSRSFSQREEWLAIDCNVFRSHIDERLTVLEKSLHIQSTQPSYLLHQLSPEQFEGFVVTRLQPIMKATHMFISNAMEYDDDDDDILFDSREMTLLHYLCALGLLQAVETCFNLPDSIHPMLLRAFDPRLVDSRMCTPLMWACAGGNDQMVRFLLKQDLAPLRMPDLWGRLPSDVARSHGHAHIANELVSMLQMECTSDVASVQGETEDLDVTGTSDDHTFADSMWAEVSAGFGHLVEKNFSALTIQDRDCQELMEVASKIHSAFHSYQQTQNRSEISEAASTIQNAFRRFKEKRVLERHMRAAAVIQANYRAYREQGRFRQSRAAAVTIQRHYRRHIAKKQQNVHQDEAAQTIQRFMKRVTKRERPVTESSQTKEGQF